MQEEFRRRGDSKNPFLSRIGIGVNSGMALAGDLGSEVKKNYSVIGDSVNVAARINSLASGGQIIITKSTLTAVEGIVEVAPLPPTTVKGKSEPLEIYELKGLTGGPARKA
jgi:class 3 adenylate cyclase